MSPQSHIDFNLINEYKYQIHYLIQISNCFCNDDYLLIKCNIKTVFVQSIEHIKG